VGVSIKEVVGPKDILKKWRRLKKEGLRGVLRGCTSNITAKLKTRLKHEQERPTKLMKET